LALAALALAALALAALALVLFGAYNSYPFFQGSKCVCLSYGEVRENLTVQFIRN